MVVIGSVAIVLGESLIVLSLALLPCNGMDLMTYPLECDMKL